MRPLVLKRDTQFSVNSLADGVQSVHDPAVEQQQYEVQKMQASKFALSDYQIGEKIGAGTFGVIVRAVNKKTNKEYAFKMINKAQISSREHAEHIVREKKVLMHLSDP